MRALWENVGESSKLTDLELRTSSGRRIYITGREGAAAVRSEAPESGGVHGFGALHQLESAVSSPSGVGVGAPAALVFFAFYGRHL